MNSILLTGHDLDLASASAVVFSGAKVRFCPQALKKVTKCAEIVADFVSDNQVIYGITTGFGSLKNIAIPADKTEELQKNLIRSHSCGWGEPLSEDLVRGMLLLRINALLQGYSGIRVNSLKLMEQFLNLHLYPYIPSRGSVGASGDLCPLSHLALSLIGEGEFLDRGSRVPALQILSKHGLEPLSLHAKEGLALINGTQLMSAMALKITSELTRLLNLSCLSAAMSLEALLGTRAAFRPELQKLRPHPGQKRIAELIYSITDDSPIINSHKNCGSVQDAYSLRCIPQVLGAVCDTLTHACRVLSIEMNSVTDNPIILNPKEVISGGNFHGEPIAMILDFLAIAITELGSIAERRIERLVNEQLNCHLPAFLVSESGANSGFMIVQYLAAALVSECKALSHPGSVDSIPTSGNQEDHVSMGPVSGFKALSILDKVKTVVTLEFLTAAQALDFCKPASSPVIRKARKLIRSEIDFMARDRAIYKDIEKLRPLVAGDELLKILRRGKLPLIE
ncbi:MAG: histidine ammonia-lyase [Candidatus Wallbacteria bacterium]|nr:histidine ammonia-lyase [Candidatus Wallbacteria bacterium]